MTDPSPVVVESEESTLGQNRYDREVLNTAKGGGILAVGRLANFGTRFVINVILARLLSAEQYGLYSLSISAATIASGIAIFGLDSTVMRFIAIMKSRKDNEGLWGVLQVGLGFTLLLNVATSTVLFALAYPIAENVFHDLRLVPLLQIAAIIAPFLSFSSVLAGATRGFKNMKDTVVAQNFIQPIVRLILIVVLALSGISVMEAVIAFGLSDLTASIVLLYFLHKKFSLFRSLRSARRETREILSFSLPLWLSDMLVQFRGNIQTVLLGSLGSISGVGIFAIVNQVNLVGNIFHASLNQSARPLIAELSDRGDKFRMKQMYQTGTKWVVSLNLPMILIIILFPVELMSIFGKSFAAGAAALVIMAFAELVNVSTGMCGSIVDMSGHTRLKLANTIVRVAASIFFSFLLIPRYGLMGAAWTSLIQTVIAN
ncbi:MAG: flippase, partial [Chloroflexi bacterium]